jgi:hypothetical protein
MLKQGADNLCAYGAFPLFGNEDHRSLGVGNAGAI